MDTPSQVWYFILQYLNTIEDRNMDLSECLNFLFQLSFAELGKVKMRRLSLTNFGSTCVFSHVSAGL
jgi:hypothetical protein